MSDGPNLTKLGVEKSDQIDRTALPIRRPPFRGVANRTLGGSQPDWDFVAPIPAPEGAPNVLLVLTDDAGFGNPGTFGGPIHTPALDRLAAGGLAAVFIFSLFLFFPALIVAYLVRDRRSLASSTA
jgi:hypothetical protein